MHIRMRKCRLIFFPCMMWTENLFYVGLFLVCIFVYVVIRGGFSLAPWVPTKKSNLERIHEFANLKSGQKFFELGSGNGRVSFFMARKNPEVFVTGIELSFFLYLWSWCIREFNPVLKSRVKLSWKDMFTVDLSSADVIYLFALPDALNTKVVEKFERELRKGARVISCAFEITGWEENLVKKDKPKEDVLAFYVYEV